jgi:hypothetical protein
VTSVESCFGLKDFASMPDHGGSRTEKQGKWSGVEGKRRKKGSMDPSAMDSGAIGQFQAWRIPIFVFLLGKLGRMNQGYKRYVVSLLRAAGARENGTDSEWNRQSHSIRTRSTVKE